MTRIIIVDPGADDSALQELCAALRDQAQLDALPARSPAEAAALLADRQRGTILLGPHYAHESALSAAAELTREHPDRLVLAMAPDSSILAMRRAQGAVPISGDEPPVPLAVQRALDEEQERHERDALVEKLRRMASIDSLTGLSNRAHFDELYARELRRAERYGTSVAVAMLDVDDFKRINDTYGHEVGDQALQAVGALLHSSVRAADVVARYGGDEFVILMPETSENGAQTVLQRARDALEGFNTLESLPVALRLSIGLGTSAADRDPLGVADRLMYEQKRAKKAGR